MKFQVPLPKFTDDPEEVEWPTVDYAHEVAATIAKKRKKRKGK
jgi:hypothetical protein